MAKYTVMSTKSQFSDKDFTGLNEAQDFASNHFAKSCGLPKGKYFLQWDIILRDQGYTRVFRSKEGLYFIVVREVK